MDNEQLLTEILRHPDIAAKLVGRRTPDGDEIAWCLFHRDGAGKPPHEPDLRIGPKGYICFACGAKGSLQALARHLGIELNGGNQWELVASWPYWSADGSQVLFYKDRFQKPDVVTGNVDAPVFRTDEVELPRSSCLRGRDRWLFAAISFDSRRLDAEDVDQVLLHGVRHGLARGRIPFSGASQCHGSSGFHPHAITEDVENIVIHLHLTP